MGHPGQPALVQLGISPLAGESVVPLTDSKTGSPKLSGGGDTTNQEDGRGTGVDGLDGVRIPKRRAQEPQGPKDDLDKLLDSLDI